MKYGFGLLLVLAVTGCKNGPEPAAAAKELKKEILTVGTGAPAKPGDTLVVLYEGKLMNGKVFDASRLHGNDPFTFSLGEGGVIKGWDQGLVGAQKGAKIKLTVPSDLAYGEAGGGDAIPPNSDLIFEITVKDIKPKGDSDSVTLSVVRAGTGPAAAAASNVTFKYAVRNSKGKTLGHNQVTTKLNNANLLPAIAEGLVGVKQGSIVDLTVPPKFSPGGRVMRYGYPMMENLTFRIELLRVK